MNQSLIISYLSLRRTIGILGILLPFALALGNTYIFGEGLQTSMSSYYHTRVGDLFVGVLFVIGLFLFSYKGYGFVDDIAGHLACVFAIGVAIFPTTPANPTSANAETIGAIHLAFAGLLFLTLAFFAIFLFTKSAPDRPVTSRKKRRNAIFRLCGIVIIICIVLTAVVNVVLPKDLASTIAQYNHVFWLEAVAVVAFGISWLVKGKALRIIAL